LPKHGEALAVAVTIAIDPVGRLASAELNLSIATKEKEMLRPSTVEVLTLRAADSALHALRRGRGCWVGKQVAIGYSYFEQILRSVCSIVPDFTL
jgi:hypothetical protein